VQVDSIITCVESAHVFSALSYNMMKRFQTLLSSSTCAAAPSQVSLSRPSATPSDLGSVSELSLVRRCRLTPF